MSSDTVDACIICCPLYNPHSAQHKVTIFIVARCALMPLLSMVPVHMGESDNEGITTASHLSARNGLGPTKVGYNLV